MALGWLDVTQQRIHCSTTILVQYNSKYNISLEAPPVLVYTKNTAFGKIKFNTALNWLQPMLYLSLNTPPCNVFSTALH